MKGIPLKRGAPVPHAMPPAELIQHVLLELLQVNGAGPVEMGTQAAGTHEALERVHDEAVSPRLRTLARRLL